MHPEAAGPSSHYHMVRGGSEKGNITVWETGTVGGEYIKTYGHYHLGDLDETYRILAGEGIALLQKRAEIDGVLRDDVIESFRAIRVKAGDQVYMPAGFGHLVANTDAQWLVTADDSPVAGPDDSASMPGHADYEAVKRMHGFAFYVVEHEGMPALVRNPRYAEVRDIDVGDIPIVEV